MPITYSRDGGALREFEREEVLREFHSPAVPGGDVVATNPVDPTIDPRLYRLPIYVLPGHSACFANTFGGGYGTDGFYWLLPDGTEQHDVWYPTYTAPSDGKVRIVYQVCKNGATMKNAANLHYIGDRSTPYYPYSYIKTEDLYYCCWYGAQVYAFGSYVGIVGDVKHLAKMAAGVTSTLSLSPTFTQGLYYGDLNTWEPLRCINIVMDNLSAVSGSLKFVDGSECYRLRMRYNKSISAEDISQTLVNWDDSNDATYDRTCEMNYTKRSQLTAEGEAAVVSLIAKGCTFTFEAE